MDETARATMQQVMQFNGDDMFKILWFITALAFMLERALAVLFEHRWWLKIREKFHLKGIKEIIAVLVAYGVCCWAQFDALAIMFRKDEPTTITLLLTAMIIAGGSKGSVKLMQDYLDIKRRLDAKGRPIEK